MIFKICGATLIVVACGGLGFLIAAAYKREVSTMQGFIFALEQMRCELQYRLTPLPELCRHVSTVCHGCLTDFFEDVASELEAQVRPDVGSCINAALANNNDIPAATRKMIDSLSVTLGRYDLEGQLSGLDALISECQQKSKFLSNNLDIRIRSYQTLGICAGAAVVILII